MIFVFHTGCYQQDSFIIRIVSTVHMITGQKCNVKLVTRGKFILGKSSRKLKFFSRLPIPNDIQTESARRSMVCTSTGSCYSKLLPRVEEKRVLLVISAGGRWYFVVLIVHTQKNGQRQEMNRSRRITFVSG